MSGGRRIGLHVGMAAMATMCLLHVGKDACRPPRSSARYRAHQVSLFFPCADPIMPALRCNPCLSLAYACLNVS